MPHYFHCQKYPRSAAQNYLHTSLTPSTDSNNNRIRLDWRPSKREINTHISLLLTDESVNKVQLQRS